MRPVQRRNGLVVQDLHGETLVYDLTRHRAISLNETATIIWNNSDGTRSPEQLAELLSLRFGESIAIEMVHLTLDELIREQMLEPGDQRCYLRGISRRDVLRKIGLTTTAALPFVLGITAPHAASAQSACIPGGSCTCSQNSSGRQGLQCTPVVQCTNRRCRCVWANNGNNPSGSCVV